MELKNKRAVFLGDSITEGWGTTDPSKVYHQILKRKYDLDMAYECGVGGTRIARRKSPTDYATKFDLFFRLRAQVMPKDVDIVVIFGGTNDFGHGDALFGDVNSTDDYTFNGALNNLINQIKNDCPNADIVYLTPLHRFDEDRCVNGTGYILKDYTDVIIETAKRHNIYLIDIFNELYINPLDPNLVPDGLHLNDDGHEILADFLGKKFSEL